MVEKQAAKLNAVEMWSIRRICGVTLRDRIRNCMLRESFKMEDDIVSKIERAIFEWFGHVERMNDERIYKTAKQCQ